MSDVAQLMRAANPVPDPATALTHDELNALLLLTRTRSGNMDVKAPETPGGQEKKKYRGWLVAAATFAVIVIVAGIGFMVANPDEPATDAPESVVMANYEAWNNGDYESYLATYTDELAQEEDEDFVRILMNANAQTETVESCRVGETSPTGDTTVECSTTQTNDFHGPAGIIDNITDTFVVNADGKVSSRVSDGSQCCYAESAFNFEFWQWLQIAYPAVFEEIRPFDNGSLPGWERDPADMLIAIQYVEEFVAQSDNFPINP